MDAEKEGPRLNHEEDKGSPDGRTMRKWRLDELQTMEYPGGEMSLVGPRPERPVPTSTRSSYNTRNINTCSNVKPGPDQLGMVKSVTPPLWKKWYNECPSTCCTLKMYPSLSISRSCFTASRS